MLFVVATPIGHLGDVSQRAIEVLASCDAILCEDTRRSSILFNRYGIKKKLISYHQFKERQLLEKILSELRAGAQLALVSDAGTPCINDPGLLLIQACIEENIPFTPIPGPCSVIQALVLSGFATDRFQFVGFLPRKPKEMLRQILCYPGTSVAFESPERLIDTLEAVQEIDPKRKVAVAREMTKSFEECQRGTPDVLIRHFQAHPPRGEIVLSFASGKMPEEKIPLDELLQMLQELHGLTLKEAIKQAAALQGVPKSAVYRQVHLDKD